MPIPRPGTESETPIGVAASWRLYHESRVPPTYALGLAGLANLARLGRLWGFSIVWRSHGIQSPCIVECDIYPDLYSYFSISPGKSFKKRIQVRFDTKREHFSGSIWTNGKGYNCNCQAGWFGSVVPQEVWSPYISPRYTWSYLNPRSIHTTLYVYTYTCSHVITILHELTRSHEWVSQRSKPARYTQRVQTFTVLGQFSAASIVIGEKVKLPTHVYIMITLILCTLIFCPSVNTLYSPSISDNRKGPTVFYCTRIYRCFPLLPLPRFIANPGVFGRTGSGERGKNHQNSKNSK